MLFMAAVCGVGGSLLLFVGVVLAKLDGTRRALPPPTLLFDQDAADPPCADRDPRWVQLTAEEYAELQDQPEGDTH